MRVLCVLQAFQTACRSLQNVFTTAQLRKLREVHTALGIRPLKAFPLATLVRKAPTELTILSRAAMRRIVSRAQ
jgi:hypothetical protein